MQDRTAAAHDASARFYAASYAAGRAVVACLSGMGVAELCIVRDADDEYAGRCVGRRVVRPAATLQCLLAGEAALVVLGLGGFAEVSFSRVAHAEARDLIGEWSEYWGLHFPTARLNDTEDYKASETMRLIDLTRYQVRRRLARKPERWALDALALRLRDEGALSGEDAERLIRAAYRRGKAHMNATGFD